MIIFIQTQADNKVIGYGSTQGTENDIELEVSEDHEVLKNPFIFKYENGELIKDEAYQQQLIQEKEDRMNKPTTEQQLSLLQKALDDLILGVM